MKIIKSLLVILLFINLYCSTRVFADEPNSESIIHRYFSLLNQQDWGDIPQTWVLQHRFELVMFLNNPKNKENKNGLFNIRGANLIALKKISYIYGSRYLPSYIDSLPSPQIYYVAVDYSVHREDKYHINGLNYFFIVTTLESGSRKIALAPHIPVSSIIRDGYGFGFLDEKTFDKRRQNFV